MKTRKPYVKLVDKIPEVVRMRSEGMTLDKIGAHFGLTKQRIAQIEKTLPEGVTIEPFLDRTKLVNNAIHTVTKNLAEGALIVIWAFEC